MAWAREPALPTVRCARLKGAASSTTDARGEAPFWEMAAGSYRLKAPGYPDLVVSFPDRPATPPRFVLARPAQGDAGASAQADAGASAVGDAVASLP